jgi:hypothetical protein
MSNDVAQLSSETRLILETLREAVQQALERKRKLGEYAVLWKDGKVVLEGEDAPK